MPMAYLNQVSDYIGEARVLLQDTIGPPYRYDDLSLVNALNISLMQTRAMRPDLFLGKYDDMDDDDIGTFTANNSSTVFMPIQYRPAILRGMLVHAMLRDQEDVQDQRAALFQKDFYSMLGLPGLAASA